MAAQGATLSQVEPKKEKFLQFLIPVLSAIGGGSALAGGAAVAGTALSLIGQNQQKKANQGAQAQNQRNLDTQNQHQWVNYLLSRGMNPTGAVTPGYIPRAGQYEPVNTRLPLWATMQVPDTRATSRWQRRASA